MKNSVTVCIRKYFRPHLRFGFTLIELLVVVLIVGILAAVAVPQYQTAVDKARFVELQTIGSKLKDMVELYYVANGSYPSQWGDLDIDIPGCQEVGTMYDLVCQKFRVDLNPTNFSGWDSTVRNGNPDAGGSYNPTGHNYYYQYSFRYGGTGKASCAGVSERGKRVCRSVCGADYCVLSN